MTESGPREIEEAVERALAAAGINGAVKLTGRTLTLSAGGAPIEIDALFLIEQWPLLPADLRQRKAADVAARLAEAHRAASEGRPAPSAPSQRYVPSVRPTGVAAPGPRKLIIVPIGVIAGVIGVVSFAVLHFVAPTKPQVQSGSTATAPPAESDELRLRRNCEEARKAMFKNNRLPSVDAQTWIAELWLASSRADGASPDKLAAFISGGKLTAAADPELAALTQAQVEIQPDRREGASWHGLRVRFRGGYVSEFFKSDGREKMNALAGKLADATGAEMGALYGRCEHLPYHDIGGWFRGSSPNVASAALLYSMAFFSEARRTNRDTSAPVELSELTASMGKAPKGSLEEAVRAAGGAFAPGVKDAPTVITFPLYGPTAAARASGEIAKAAGMGADSPR